MKFTINREELLAPLQTVNGVVERKQSLPILSNVLMSAQDKKISLTTTDMEVELVTTFEQGVSINGETTLPARKLLDICRALPEGAPLQLDIKQDQAVLTSGKSRFSLATLPAKEFPVNEEISEKISFKLTQNELKKLLEDTMFAMAQQDVRYYLNGLLLEVSSNLLRSVATDGHRLALKQIEAAIDTAGSTQIIVPRKGVSELIRLLDNKDEAVGISIGQNHIRIEIGKIRFTSKLIDGKFPDYERVIPNTDDNTAIADREKLRQSLMRASILSNEKYKGIGIQIKPSVLKAHAHNAEQEEAQEEIDIEYEGDEMEIGFNVTYLLDALAAIKTEKVRITVKDPNSSCLLLPANGGQCKYVVMPMRL